MLLKELQIPEPIEDEDRVFVIIRKRIIKNEIIKLVNIANSEYNLRQKEIMKQYGLQGGK